MIKVYLVLILLGITLSCLGTGRAPQEQDVQQVDQYNPPNEQNQEIDQNQPVSENPTYTSDIKPILDANCVSCHKPGGIASNSPLTTYEEVVNGVASENACKGTGMQYVVKGNPNQSLLYLKITNPPCGAKMPQGSSLSQGEIDTIRRWIEIGAPE